MWKHDPSTSSSLDLEGYVDELQNNFHTDSEGPGFTLRSTLKYITGQNKWYVACVPNHLLNTCGPDTIHDNNQYITNIIINTGWQLIGSGNKL